MRRFDKFTEAAAAPPVPKHSEATPATTVKTETNGIAKPAPKPTNGTSKKRSSPSDSASLSDAEDDDESQLSSLEASPPPKKKPKASRSTEDSDAAFAARLQAEENRAGRATRGAATGKRKAAPGKKVKKEKKKKSKARIGSEEDSDVEGGEKKEVKRNGGFHVGFLESLAVMEYELISCA
jgi:upstream activation factor subunit UAF30